MYIIDTTYNILDASLTNYNYIYNIYNIDDIWTMYNEISGL